MNQIKINKDKLYILTGCSYLVIGFFGITKWGFIGRLVVNVFRFFVGNTYPILGLICLFYGCLLLLLKKELKFKRSSLFYGLLLLYISLLCLVSLLWPPDNLASNGNLLLQMLKNSYQDIQTNSVSLSLGGGIVGSLFYQGGWLLLKKIGVYFIVCLTAICGIWLIRGKKKA